MKDKMLNIVLVLLLLTLWIQYIHPKYDETQRYEIVPANNMLTVLIDKKTGTTWRNCVCGGKYPILGCWEKMHTLDEANFNLPLGEQITRPKELKLIQKMQKEGAMNQQLQNQQAQGQAPQQMPQQAPVKK